MPGHQPEESGPVGTEMVSVMYEDLRRLAWRFVAGQRPGLTLGATDLVHETYLRMSARGDPTWSDKAHFYRSAAQAMRHILVDRARKRNALRRGGDRLRLDLEDDHAVVESPTDRLLILDEALDRLKQVDERMHEIVMLRYFAGLTLDESATIVGVSLATAKRDWAYAKAWLYEQIGECRGSH